MDVTFFRRLSAALEQKLEKDVLQRARFSTGYIAVDGQEALFIRTMAGAEYLEVMIVFRSSRPVV